MRSYDGVVMTHPIFSASFADCASLTSSGCGSYGGTQDQIDVRVGLSAVGALGDVVDQHSPLALIHAADAAQFAQAAMCVREAIEIADHSEPLPPLIQALPARGDT